MARGVAAVLARGRERGHRRPRPAPRRRAVPSPGLRGRRARRRAPCPRRGTTRRPARCHPARRRAPSRARDGCSVSVAVPVDAAEANAERRREGGFGQPGVGGRVRRGLGPHRPPHRPRQRGAAPARPGPRSSGPGRRRRRRRGGRSPSRSGGTGRCGTRPWSPWCSRPGTRARRARRTAKPTTPGPPRRRRCSRRPIPPRPGPSPSASNPVTSRPTRLGNSSRARARSEPSRAAPIDAPRRRAEPGRRRRRRWPPSVDPRTAPDAMPRPVPTAVWATPAVPIVAVQRRLDVVHDDAEDPRPGATRAGGSPITPSSATPRAAARGFDTHVADVRRPVGRRRRRQRGSHHFAASTSSPTVSPTTPAAPSTSPVKPPIRLWARARTRAMATTSAPTAARPWRAATGDRPCPPPARAARATTRHQGPALATAHAGSDRRRVEEGRGEPAGPGVVHGARRHGHGGARRAPQGADDERGGGRRREGAEAEHEHDAHG